MIETVSCYKCGEPIIFALYHGRRIPLDAEANEKGYFDVRFGAEPNSDNYAKSVRVTERPDPRVQCLYRGHKCKKVIQ